MFYLYFLKSILGVAVGLPYATLLLGKYNI
jgi:hypothetical protein